MFPPFINPGGPMKRLASVLALLCILRTAGAATYFVSTNGNDDAAGTAGAPFRSVGKAAATMKAGDTCRVRGGTYAETVKPANSGTAEGEITFENWEKERPLVVGHDPVTGWERVVDGNTWRAPIAWDLGKHNQVFINGTPGQEARRPNKTDDDPLNWEGMVYDKGSCNQFLLCSKLPDRPNGYWRSATLWVMTGAKWTSWSTVIADSADSGRKLLFDMPANQGSVPKHMSPADRRGGFFYLVGLKGELDAPGEWFLDGAEKMLYLQVADGQNPNSMRIAAKRRRLAFDLSGRKHVRVCGFDVLGASVSVE